MFRLCYLIFLLSPPRRSTFYLHYSIKRDNVDQEFHLQELEFTSAGHKNKNGWTSQQIQHTKNKVSIRTRQHHGDTKRPPDRRLPLHSHSHWLWFICSTPPAFLFLPGRIRYEHTRKHHVPTVLATSRLPNFSELSTPLKVKVNEFLLNIQKSSFCYRHIILWHLVAFLIHFRLILLRISFKKHFEMKTPINFNPTRGTEFREIR